ncbi:DUF3667 domain-containing protein [Fibrella arboris]|uniref:DUF3667 domain-containing protein n=1 Tax=Fibrella arboris TaxID=3242486 RepID=UPI0035209B52
MTTCKNCSTDVFQNYCANCGQPAKLKRIDGHYIAHELEHLLHVERGIVYTIKELLIRPGETIRHFISEDRSRLVKPVIFIIITSLIYTIAIKVFHVHDGIIQFDEKERSATGAIFGWIVGNYGYSNILWGAFIAAWAKLFFRKYNYNFYEILILLCFVQGMVMLLFSVFLIFQELTHIHVQKLEGSIGLLYFSWAVGQFFDQKKPLSYLKAFASYMLGTLTFLLLAILIGAAIDMVIKY